jgi:hypothetical protein
MSSNEIGGAMFVGAFFIAALVMAVRGAYFEHTFGGWFVKRWISKADEPDAYWIFHIGWIVAAIGFGAFTIWLLLRASCNAAV